MKLKRDEKGNVVVVDEKPVYIHEDGKEIPFDAVKTVETIGRLNKEAQTNRERAEGVEAKLKDFEGIDVGAARKALDTVKKIDEAKLVDAGKVDEVKAAAIRATEEKFAGERKSLMDEAERLKSDNDKITRQYSDEKIGGSFTRSKFITDKFTIPADMVQARFGQHFKIEEGKIVAYDSAGTKIFSRTRPGEVAEFDEALETLVDKYPYKEHILKGAVSPGGGAPNPNGGGGGNGKAIKRAAFEQLHPEQQMKHFEGGGTVTD